jgi:hypothetical protein
MAASPSATLRLRVAKPLLDRPNGVVRYGSALHSQAKTDDVIIHQNYPYYIIIMHLLQLRYDPQLGCSIARPNSEYSPADSCDRR